MKSFYIPLFILAFLIGSALALGIVTEQRTARWEEKAERVEQAAVMEAWDDVDEQLATLTKSWDAWQTFLHTTLPHDHITDTQHQLELALFHAKERDGDTLRETLTELKGHFRTLSDQGELSLRNLF